MKNLEMHASSFVGGVYWLLMLIKLVSAIICLLIWGIVLHLTVFLLISCFYYVAVFVRNFEKW